MQPDTRIPLAFQTPDFVGSMARGAQAGQFVNEARHQNQFRNALAQHGAGLVAGESGARNALAGFDPGMVMQADAHRQTMDHNEQRLQLAYQQASMKAQQFAMDISAQEREALRAEFERGSHMIGAAQTPEQFAQVIQLPGVAEAVEAFVGPGMLTFENRGIIYAASEGAKDALAVTQPEQPGPQSSAGRFFQDQRDGFVPADVPFTGSGVTVNAGDQRPHVDSQGRALVQNENGEWIWVTPPGSAAEQARQEGEESRERQEAMTARQLNPTIDDIQTARDLAEVREFGFIPRTGMFAGLLQYVPFVGQGSVDLAESIDAIGAGISLENLNQMRQASPTGGALGNVSDKQSALLSSAFGSLAQAQSQPLFLYNLARVENVLNDIVHGPDAGPPRHDLSTMRQDLRSGQGIPNRSLPPDVNVWADESPSQAPRSGPSDDDLLRLYGGD